MSRNALDFSGLKMPTSKSGKSGGLIPIKRLVLLVLHMGNLA